MLVWLGCASAPLSPIAEPPRPPSAEELEAAERLAGGVRFETISYDGRPDESGPAFVQMHEYLARSFPLAHRVLEREVIGRLSLLYTWPGSEPDAGAVLLSAHLDVVPIEAETREQWLQPPFSGAIVDGEIWGRGAWDDKGNLFAMLEAVERLAAQGFRPRQTVYFAFGHNEELGGGGEWGAMAIAAHLASKQVRLDFVLDEGLLVVDGALAGLEAPRALVALEENPLPASSHFFLSNLWLFEPLVRAKLSRSPSVNAMMRTTTALTVLSAGGKSTSLPGLAQAQLNFRLLPGDTVAAVLAHVKEVVGDDPDIEVLEVQPSWEGSRVSDTNSPSYARLTRAIHALFPEAVVAPGLMLGATDSRAYAALAAQIYRFSPLRGSQVDLSRFHGLNERVSVSGYMKMIGFYQHLLGELR